METTEDIVNTYVSSQGQLIFTCDLLKETKSSRTETPASAWSDAAHNSWGLLLNPRNCRWHESFYSFCAPDLLCHKAVGDHLDSAQKMLQKQSLPPQAPDALVWAIGDLHLPLRDGARLLKTQPSAAGSVLCSLPSAASWSFTTGAPSKGLQHLGISQFESCCWTHPATPLLFT